MLIKNKNLNKISVISFLLVSMTMLSCRIPASNGASEEQKEKNGIAGEAHTWEKNAEGKLADWIKTFIQKEGDEGSESNYSFMEVDLNNDALNDYLVRLEGDSWCGTGGCTVLIVEQQPDELKLLNDLSTVQDMSVAEENNDGWQQIKVEIGGGGSKPETLLYVYDKNRAKYILQK